MAIPARTADTGTFFITTITHNRRRLFQLPANAELFLQTLQHDRTQGAYKLHAFVVMPDHVHLLLTPTGHTLSRVMNLIKGGFSRRLPSNFPLWQKGFTDHLVLDADHFHSRRQYIHQNPVRAHLTQTAEAYPYSSSRTSPDDPQRVCHKPRPKLHARPTTPIPTPQTRKGTRSRVP